eukprot:TRINITY_DN16451_c0_g1_i1.p1 TRINITY_DN16451_c0_g1~~TRINITY_DN16451_c0_g1_i1.p1  ORF type:complete len:754 (+),score=272.48 TRINITY_DN16451_c0_g1_i1:20-2281(+)
MKVIIALALLLCSLIFIINCNVIEDWKELDNIPRGWNVKSLLNGKNSMVEEIKVTFAIKQENRQLLEDILLNEVSNPKSEQFREYLSLKDIEILTMPDLGIKKEINDWLVNVVGATVDWSINSEFVVAYIPVSNFKSKLGLQLAVFEHCHSSRSVIRAFRYNSKTVDHYEDFRGVIPSMPESIKEHIDLTLGLFDFFDTKVERRNLHQCFKKEETKKEEATSNVPYIYMILGGTTDLTIYWNPYCQDGSDPSLSGSKLVCDNGVNIEKFKLSVHPDNLEETDFLFTEFADYCQKYANNDHSVSCQYTTNIERAYTRVNVTIEVFYTDSSSVSYNYPTRYAPTDYILPQRIFDTYNIPYGTAGTNPNNSQAIVSFEEQYISEIDLSMFYDYIGYPQYHPTIIGPNNSSIPGGEATLDVQYISGVGKGVPTTVWSFPVGDYVLNWALAVANTTNPPLVTSISYGDTEIGYIQKSGYGLSYIYRMNYELIKMNLRGLTTICGSGDAGWTNVGEMGNDLSAPDQTCDIGRAFFPSCSPFVLSLSSSFLSSNNLPICSQGVGISPVPGFSGANTPFVCTDKPREVVVSVSGGMSWTTGGGFSNITERYEYQENLVQHYLDTNQNLPPSNQFNASGQGYADITTIGWNQVVVWFGNLFPIGGTSASGPVMAGILALLNDQLLNKGENPVGFVNPMLYDLAVSNPECFNDIVYGNNNDGDIQPPGSSYPIFCENGFSAAPGWDPASGLGSPNFRELAKHI